MQLNIYVPKDKQDIVRKLDAAARVLGRPKNELVIEALEKYLRTNSPTVRLGKYPTRVIGSLSRTDIYGDRVKE
jgi:hypothetical protein